MDTGDAHDDDTNAPAHDEMRARPTRTWIAAGAGALAVASIAVFGLQAVQSHDAGTATTTATGGINGAASGAAAPGGQRGAPGDQFGAPGRGVSFGAITNITESGLTLDARTGSAVMVTTSDETTVSSAKAGTVDAIKAGDHVTVVGVTSGAAVAAERIVDTGEQEPAAWSASSASSTAPTRGVVESVRDSTLTIATNVGTTNDGTTITVTTTSDTRVSMVRPAQLSDLRVGDRVMVLGTTDNGTIAATAIREGVTSGGAGGTAPSGPPMGPGTTGGSGSAGGVEI